jgi:hypothetical protein
MNPAFQVGQPRSKVKVVPFFLGANPCFCGIVKAPPVTFPALMPNQLFQNGDNLIDQAGLPVAQGAGIAIV